MTANAQQQVERMLALVPYLRSRAGVSVDDVAEDFGVDPAQIVKDLKVLWFCGLPDAVTGDLIEVDMDALDEERIVRLSNADFLTRPLRLAPHEAFALVVALRTLLEVGGPAQRDAVQRAVAKVEAAAGGTPPGLEAVDVQVEPVDESIRAAIDEALDHGRRLHLSYYVPSRDETTERDVDPYRLIFSDGNTYLEAWCHRVSEVRMFRVDRVAAVRVLDEEAAPPPDAQRPDLSQGLFQPDPDDPVAELDLTPQGRWVADYFPVDDATERPDGRLRVRLRYTDPQWLVRLVLRLGGAAELMAPADLVAATRDRARAALAQYSSG